MSVVCIKFLASRKTIRESQNQAVLNKLIKEVKSLNQTFDVADIRGNLHSTVSDHVCTLLQLLPIAFIEAEQRKIQGSEGERLKD